MLHIATYIMNKTHFLILFSLKNEVGIIMDNMKKHVEHKDTLKMMNDALKRQVDLVKEECELRIKVSKSLFTFSPKLDHDSSF